MNTVADKSYKFQARSSRVAAERLLGSGRKQTDSVFILDEVGLGKTHQALDTIRRVRLDMPTAKAIIVVPSRKNIKQWRHECQNNFKFNIEVPSDTVGDLLKDGKICLVAGVSSSGVAGSLDIAFVAGSELGWNRPSDPGRRAAGLNRLEREYIMSSFPRRWQGEAFFKKLQTPRAQIPDYSDARSEYGGISAKDPILRSAVRELKNLHGKISERLFKWHWLLACGRQLPFKIIIVDEFHHYISLLAKKDNAIREKEDYEAHVWDEFFGLKEDGGDVARKKVFLSATPFRPIRLNVHAELGQDPVSYVLDALSNTFSESARRSLKENILQYNQDVLKFRKACASEAQRLPNQSLWHNEKLQELAKEIRKLTDQIAEVLNVYLLRNRRKQRDAVRDTKREDVGAATSFFLDYLRLHEALCRKGVSRDKQDLIEQFYTSADVVSRKYYPPNEYKTMVGVRELLGGEVQALNGDHLKMARLKSQRPIKGILSNRSLPCWLSPLPKSGRLSAGNSVEKALIFCSYNGTLRYLSERLTSREPMVRRQLKPAKYLIEDCRKMFKDIGIADHIMEQYRQELEEFARFLPVYIKRWGLPSSSANSAEEVRQYIKRHHLRQVMDDYFQHVCTGNPEVFFRNLRSITEWTLKSSRTHHGIVARYVESSGAKKDKRGGSERLEDLRAAFNSPFFPYILVATNAGSESVNLHSYCRTVFHYEQDWMPARIEQRTGRVDRINSLAARLRAAQLQHSGALEDFIRSHSAHVLEPGKPEVESCNCSICSRRLAGEPEKINVFRLIVDGTIDEYMFNRERERALWTDLFIGGEDSGKLLDGSVGLRGEISDNIRRDVRRFADLLRIRIGNDLQDDNSREVENC